MLTLKEIQEKLQDRHIPTVATKSGVSYRTVYNIKVGSNDNPSVKVIEKLSAYFGVNQ